MARNISLVCDYAWAAGFFDGEGCTRVNRTTNPRSGYKYDILVIQISQKDREVLDRFREIMDGYGNIYQRKDGTYLFSCGKESEVHEILERMWLWLGSIKRKQANDAIKRAVGRVAA